MNQLELNKAENLKRRKQLYFYNRLKADNKIPKKLQSFVRDITNNLEKENKYITVSKTVRERYSPTDIRYYSNSLTIDLKPIYLFSPDIDKYLGEIIWSSKFVDYRCMKIVIEITVKYISKNEFKNFKVSKVFDLSEIIQWKNILFVDKSIINYKPIEEFLESEKERIAEAITRSFDEISVKSKGY